MIAANSASSSSYDVRIRARIDGSTERTVAAHLDARAVGQPGVEHRDVGAQRGDPVGGLLRRPGLPDDLDVAGALEQGAQPLADDLVVVEQVHPDLLVSHADRCTPGGIPTPTWLYGAAVTAALDAVDPLIRARRDDDLPELARVLAEQQPVTRYPLRWPLPFPVEQFLVRATEEIAGSQSSPGSRWAM